MWPFRRRDKGENAEEAVPVLDPALGDPAGTALLDQLKRRDWPSAHAFLGTIDDPDDKAFYVDLASDVPGLQAWAADWNAAQPRSALPVLVRGAHAISWAWQARGSAMAKDTSQAQFQMFQQRLKLAEDCLNEATARDRGDPTAWALLVLTAVGRSLGTAEAGRRFNEAIARHRWHGRAHSLMLMHLCAKWGGSHEQMHAFAEGTVAAAPLGSPLGALVPSAHIERWLSMPADEDSDYLHQPDVQASVRNAADRSVRHPAYRRRPGWPGPHNAFAMVYTIADEHDAASEQFDAIGDLVTKAPWYYLNGGSALAYARARAYSYGLRSRVRS